MKTHVREKKLMPAGSLRHVATFFLLLFLVACSRPPELVGVDNPSRPVDTLANANKKKVYIATTRQASEATGVFFSGERAPDLAFASVVVSVPHGHVTGKVERPAFLPPQPESEFAIVDPTLYETSSVFVSSLNRALAELPPKDRHILLFVHGYNNTISDSLLRISQFVEDTGFSGVPVLFSWASAAKTTHYVYDLNSALVARPRLLETARVLSQTNARGFDLMAHSMGAFLTMEAIVQANIAGTYNKSGRLQNVLLAAPDIDVDLFRSQLSQMPKSKVHFYVLVSDTDSALGFSERISGGIEKVGSTNADRLSGLGVNVIDISRIDDVGSGAHSKFSESAEIVQLIGRSLQLGHLEERPQTALGEMLSGAAIVMVRPE